MHAIFLPNYQKVQCYIACLAASGKIREAFLMPFPMSLFLGHIYQDVAVIDAQKKEARIGGLVAGVLWQSKTAVYSRLDSAAGPCPYPRSTGDFQCRRLRDGCLLAAAWNCGQKAQRS